MAQTLDLLTSRFSFSGEIPTNYPGLRPRAIARINEQAPPTGAYWDGVDDSRYWQMQWDGTSALWGRAGGRTGGRLQINAAGANYERGRLQLDHFSGLWPSSSQPRLLIGGWFWQTYEMAFNPLIDTRATDPIAYLSTAGGTGDPRIQVYNSSGTLIHDEYESAMPWKQTTDGYFLGAYVDGSANTVQMFSVHEDGRRWLGPVRDFIGTPNWGSTANVDLYSLRHANYWEAGFLDDVVIANPTSSFDLDQFVEDLGNSVWANGYARPERDDDFEVTDDAIERTASGTDSFTTGAARLSWDRQPSFEMKGTVSAFVSEVSTDDGDTWGTSVPEEAEDALVRFEVSLASGGTFTGVTATIPEPEDEEVTPTAPVRDGNTVTISSQTGVIWTPPPGTHEIPVDGSLEVTASPDDGYQFPSGATTEWTFDYEATEVTPEEPDHDEENNTVTVPDQTGVVWLPNGPGQYPVPEDGTLVIEAEPDEGYTFPSGATTSWEYEYTWPDPPVLEPIQDFSLLQGGDVQSVTLEYEVGVPPYRWDVLGNATLATVTVEDGILSVAVGYETGLATYTVRLTDDRNRSVEQSFTVEVAPRPWIPGPPPRYPHAPIVLWGEDGPEEVLIDPVSAVVIEELNGEQSFEFTIPANHRLRHLVQNERIVEAAGERYHVRRITSERESGVPVFKVFAEARFYDLRVAGGVDPQEWEQTLPGTVMELAVRGTDWTVDTVNVGTRRTYGIEERTNPLALLRMVQENHGGDLIFDNVNRRVSLVVQSGRDQGVGFFYASNLNSAKRVEDTGSLVTRIYPRNEDGQTIASVNNGQPYLEDFTYSSEVRETTYNFKAGTSPYTMLDMASATLANRSRPDVSYECTVSDLSAETGDDLDRFEVGDVVTVADPEIGIDGEQQRIVGLEYNLLEPWNSDITLSARLRETGSSDGTEDSLGTGSTVSAFDLVPFNLLLNARFDNGLAHWANSGVDVVETDRGTGDYAVRFSGSGQRWIEQTVTPDNRSAYAFSMEVNSSGGPSGWAPDLIVEAVVEYEDGETETIVLDLGGDEDFAGDDPDGE